MLGGFWLLVVSPERKQAANLATQVSTASAQLATAEGQVANARARQAQYAAAYASIVSLGKAVPPGWEVPSLIYQIAQALTPEERGLQSITSTAAAGASGSRLRDRARRGNHRLHAMPFTFVFDGSFFDL